MTFAEIIAATVPEKQEAVRKALADLEGAVKISSREEADAAVKANKFLFQAFQGEVDKKLDEYVKRYDAEKLPGIVEAKVAEELAKRTPKPKDPEVAAALEAAQKAQRELDEWRSKAVKSERLARVSPKLAELGLDSALAEMLIGDSDELTDKRLEVFTGSVAKMRDSYAEKILKERYGNSAPPSTGTAPKPMTREALQAQYKELMASGRKEEAAMIDLQLLRLKE